MRRARLCLALVSFLGSAMLSGAGARASDQTDHAGLSLVETGNISNGKALYNIKADRVEITEILKTLFRKTGEEYSIDQDVTGTVDLVKNGATIDEILELVREQARPPLRIARGKFTRVSVGTDTRLLAAQAQQRINQARGGYSGLLFGQSMPGYPADDNPFNRRVSLNIPDDRPVPLADALDMIERQTHVPIRLDRSLPRTARFSAVFTQAPLSFVLDAITKTGALKWVTVSEGDGYILIAPTDRMQVLIADVVAGSYPAVVCTRCHAPLAASWAYCPLCGQLAPRTPQNQGRQAVPRGVRRTQGGTPH